MQGGGDDIILAACHTILFSTGTEADKVRGDVEAYAAVRDQWQPLDQAGYDVTVDNPLIRSLLVFILYRLLIIYAYDEIIN